MRAVPVVMCVMAAILLSPVATAGPPPPPPECRDPGLAETSVVGIAVSPECHVTVTFVNPFLMCLGGDFAWRETTIGPVTYRERVCDDGGD